MSATDRMRARARKARDSLHEWPPGSSEREIAWSALRAEAEPNVMEALCDIADHARALIKSGVHDDDGDAVAIRAALARLDGEDNHAT